MQEINLRLRVAGNEVEISCLRRPGNLAPLLCLHGFGSTKEDYADLALTAEFKDRDLIMFDTPGFGASSTSDPNELSIPFLVDTAKSVLDALDIHDFHLSGHSMGGLTGLLLAHEMPKRVLSFIDIEGNVAPEDCFLSRQIIQFPASSPEAFFEGFIERVSERQESSSRLYASTLAFKVRASSARPIFESMVDLSDHRPLMDMFTSLPCPRAFIYGEQNRHLSYLNKLATRGVNVIEISHSGHFPMYSNPVALWSEMAGFLERSESLT